MTTAVTIIMLLLGLSAPACGTGTYHAKRLVAKLRLRASHKSNDGTGSFVQTLNPKGCSGSDFYCGCENCCTGAWANGGNNWHCGNCANDFYVTTCTAGEWCNTNGNGMPSCHPVTAAPTQAPSGPGTVGWSLVVQKGGNTNGLHWSATNTYSYSKQTKLDITNDLTAGVTYDGFSMSDEQKEEWSSTVTNTFTDSVTEQCNDSCSSDEYLWAAEVSTPATEEAAVGLLLPQCSKFLCSPYGQAMPPKCPFGWCGSEAGCQCCSSNGWAADPSEPGLPPICA